MMVFQKTPSKFASKITKMAKNRGSFLGTFTSELLFQHQMQSLCRKFDPHTQKLVSTLFSPPLAKP